MDTELDCTIDETTFATASPRKQVQVLNSGSWENPMYPKVDKLSLFVMLIVYGPERAFAGVNYK